MSHDVPSARQEEALFVFPLQRLIDIGKTSIAVRLILACSGSRESNARRMVESGIRRADSIHVFCENVKKIEFFGISRLFWQ